jgi:hypothetical protein
MVTKAKRKVADLVVLDASPPESVENLTAISGVVLRRRYFDRSALDRMKDEVEAAYRE